MNGLRSHVPVALLVAALVVSGCSAADVADSGGSGGAQTVAVQVNPASTEVKPNETAQFAAAVTGAADTAVVWSVVEANGGSVNATGLYTAPGATGTYHVKATAHADSTVSAIAAVTVTPAPAVQVVINPVTASVTTGRTVSFTATVSNATNTAVTWRVAEASGCGSVTAAGVYTAPSAAATCHVVATSVQDTTRSATATVTVTAPTPIVVTISPSTPTVNACTTQTFTATVTGTSNTAVTWSVTEAAGGSITSGGVYTAPSTAGTYHVVATSAASSSSKATATITVADKILSVVVSPSTLTLAAGATGQFTATVTTSCGSYASVQSVTAPSN